MQTHLEACLFWSIRASTWKDRRREVKDLHWAVGKTVSVYSKSWNFSIHFSFRNIALQCYISGCVALLPSLRLSSRLYFLLVLILQSVLPVRKERKERQRQGEGMEKKKHVEKEKDKE